jgi:hypothetical protein
MQLRSNRWAIHVFREVYPALLRQQGPTCITDLLLVRHFPRETGTHS